MSVALAPRDRMSENAAWPGVSMNVTKSPLEVVTWWIVAGAYYPGRRSFRSNTREITACGQMRSKPKCQFECTPDLPGRRQCAV